MNAREVYELREDMEHQCVAEDSKTRIYLSAVRKVDHEDIERWIRKKEVIRKKKRKARLRKTVLIAMQMLQITVSLCVGWWVYTKVSMYMALIRGTSEIGSEFLIGGLAAALFYLWLNWLMGGDK